MTSLASNIKTNNVRVLDPAVVPARPVSPDVPKAVLLAIGLGAAAVGRLALLLDALDSTVKTQEDIEQTAGLTFLGLIPSIEKSDRNGGKSRQRGRGRLRATLFVYTHPTSQVAECCRAIRTNLLFMSPDRPAKSLVITSAGPQEGKTTVAASLGITMAVVRAEGPAGRHRHAPAPAAQGLRYPLGGRRPLLGHPGRGQRVELHPGLGRAQPLVAPLWPFAPNPAELLHADRFRNIVDELAGEFDLVIFDSPPLGAVTDAAILARMTEATLLVAKAGRTSKYALDRARRHIGRRRRQRARLRAQRHQPVASSGSTGTTPITIRGTATTRRLTNPR